MSEAKITNARLREIIKEELAKQQIDEAVDHASMSAVATSASKLLAAVESFKEKASAHAINAVTPGLAELEKTLENMVSNPGSYVMKPKVEPKKVSLRAVKSKDTV